MNEVLKITKLAWAYLSRDPLQIIKIFFVPTVLAICALVFGSFSGLAIGIVCLVTILNSIVLFHRFSVLGERVEGLIPTAKIGLSLVYFVNLIITSFVAGLAILPITLLVNSVSSSLWFLMLPAMAVYYWVLARISPILVGGAIGVNVRIREAWRQTKPASLAFAILAVIYVIVEAIFAYLPEFLYTILYIIYALYGIAVITASYRLYLVDNDAHDE